MKTIITDLDNLNKEYFNINSDDLIIYANECKNSCIGCFSCWVKHPRYCIYKDNYSNIVDYLKDSTELIIISKNRYGCYSKKVKQILERCIGYVLPYFTIRNNEIHHASRFKNKINFIAYFYGNFSSNDKCCLYNLVKANSVNLNALKFSVKYLEGDNYIYSN